MKDTKKHTKKDTNKPYDIRISNIPKKEIIYMRNRIETVASHLIKNIAIHTYVTSKQAVIKDITYTVQTEDNGVFLINYFYKYNEVFTLKYVYNIKTKINDLYIKFKSEDKYQEITNYNIELETCDYVIKEDDKTVDFYTTLRLFILMYNKNIKQMFDLC